MNSAGWLFGLLCLLAAAAVVIWNNYRTKKTMDAIERMLHDAMDGSFAEKTFDESRMAALETKFAHYLAASGVSAKNVSAERDRIKTLIADISHQTKTPVANLLLHSELLREEALTESARGSAEAVYEQSQKLRFLIDALVKLSRLENGIISLTPRSGRLLPMLERVVEQFSQSAQDKGLSLRLEQTDACAVFDPKWTAEALGNIIDNAIKYTAQGGVLVSVESYEMFVRINIADSGAGIPQEELARIFSRFYRSQRVKDHEGVGIGLYLAREIISDEGGYIRVRSKEGEGSVFSVFLPR